MSKKGKELNPYSLGFAQVVAVSETDEQAERDYAKHMDYFYNRCLHVYPGFADAPGYRTPSTIKAGLTGQVGKNASLTREGLKWKDFIATAGLTRADVTSPALPETLGRLIAAATPLMEFLCAAVGVPVQGRQLVGLVVQALGSPDSTGPLAAQDRIRDLAEALIGLGHEVSVISPADDDTPLPEYVVPAGRAVPGRADAPPRRSGDLCRRKR